MISKKNLFIFLTLSFSLFIGFYLAEDPSGGGIIDNKILSPYVEKFAINLSYGFEFYGKNPAAIIHSPIFYIIQSLFTKHLGSLLTLNIIYVIISLSLPYIFYLNIKKNKNFNNDYIFFVSLIIFFSPYYRSSSVWLLGDNLSLIFFSLSIYFFLSARTEENKLKNFLFCFFFLILCSYIRYYYSLYFIYFFYFFLKTFNKFTIIKILFFCLVLSTPALLYLYFIIENYNFLDILSNFSRSNIYSNILIIFSIILFYLVPIIHNELLNIYFHFKKYIINFSLIFIIVIILYLVDKYLYFSLISFSPNGGGVIFKLLNIFELEKSLFLSLITFITIVILDYLFQTSRLTNYLLLLILIFSLPFTTIYQKYLDPLFFLLLFCLVRSHILENILINKKLNLKIFFSYFIFFYIFATIYYSKIV